MSFHQMARPAAAVGQAILEQLGSTAFWKYRAALVAALPADDPDPDDLTPLHIEQAATAVRFSRDSIREALASPSIQQKIDQDIETLKALDGSGAPHSFINGREISGAQPIEKFEAIIEAELQRASRSPKMSACELTAVALKERPPSTPKSNESPADTTTVWKISAGQSPSRGPAAALVTIIEFGGYQDRFTRRVEPTLRKIREVYGDKVRIVWKDLPLPFHLLSEPATHLAREILATKGKEAFWSFHDKLLDQKLRQQNQLTDAALAEGLDLPLAQTVISSKKHEIALQEDLMQGEDFAATGTPHFFINGRRLIGAQPFEKFKSIIDEEIPRAEALLAKGTRPASLYDALIAQGKSPLPPPRVTVAAPSKQAPSRGSSQAKVVIQEFGGFQDPFTKKAEATLLELQKIYKNKIRIVWRHRMMPFHRNAQVTAEAALEAMAQQGPDAFWKMHDLLLSHQGDEGGLEPAAIEGYAQLLGLDLPRFRAALQSHTHVAAIEADMKAADEANINGTPTFSINGYLISGARSLLVFRRTIDRALAE